MADFERRQFEIGLKFVCRSFAELNNFSEGSSKPKKDAQVIRVRGAVAPKNNFYQHPFGSTSIYTSLNTASNYTSLNTVSNYTSRNYASNHTSRNHFNDHTSYNHASNHTSCNHASTITLAGPPPLCTPSDKACFPPFLPSPNLDAAILPYTSVNAMGVGGVSQPNSLTISAYNIRK